MNELVPMDIRQLKTEFEAALAVSCKSLKSKEIIDIVTTSNMIGGKRVRPLLCLLACEVFGGNGRAAMDQAIAIELFHNFSLIHDDIMDEAPVRRGKPSVYGAKGRDKAILSGDVVLILAYAHLLKNMENDVSETVMACFCKTAVEVCEGQWLDMEMESEQLPSHDNYLEMIKGKTSVLIAAALKIGALVGGATEVEAENLYKYGLYHGLAFQIQDDLLDLYADEESLGKQIGGDIIRSKKNILAIICANMKSVDQIEFLKLYDDQIINPLEKVILVKSIYDNNNVPSEVKKIRDDYHNMANDYLSKINIDAEKLMDLNAFLTRIQNRAF